MTDPKDMYQCQITNCGFVYDPEKRNRKTKLPLGTKFEALPVHWKCPVCGVSDEVVGRALDDFMLSSNQDNVQLVFDAIRQQFLMRDAITLEQKANGKVGNFLKNTTQLLETVV